MCICLSFSQIFSKIIFNFISIPYFSPFFHFYVSELDSSRCVKFIMITQLRKWFNIYFACFPYSVLNKTKEDAENTESFLCVSRMT